jgi:hypothetical protein
MKFDTIDTVGLRQNLAVSTLVFLEQQGYRFICISKGIVTNTNGEGNLATIKELKPRLTNKFSVRNEHGYIVYVNQCQKPL